MVNDRSLGILKESKIFRGLSDDQVKMISSYTKFLRFNSNDRRRSDRTSFAYYPERASGGISPKANERSFSRKTHKDKIKPA